MDYQSKLFGIIPYRIRDGKTPSYSDTQVEKMLATHYGSIFAPMIYVKDVFHDNKNNGGMLFVEYFINYGKKDYQWFGEVNGDQEDGIALQFQNVSISHEEIDYSIQMNNALTNYFLRNTSFTPDKINKHFTKDQQIEAFKSVKKYIDDNKAYLDNLIKNSEYNKVMYLLEAHLRKIDVDLSHTTGEILDTIKKGMINQENIVKRACKELGITQKELSDKLGVDDGTVRKWASEATKTPEWAEKFIALILETEKTPCKTTLSPLYQ